MSTKCQNYFVSSADGYWAAKVKKPWQLEFPLNFLSLKISKHVNILFNIFFLCSTSQLPLWDGPLSEPGVLDKLAFLIFRNFETMHRSLINTEEWNPKKEQLLLSRATSSIYKCSSEEFCRGLIFDSFNESMKKMSNLIFPSKSSSKQIHCGKCK